MLLGLLLLLPRLYNWMSMGSFKMSIDYAFIVCLGILLFLGYIINFSTTTWIKMQAYVLMLFTYVYVKENTRMETISFFIQLTKYFILVNGFFIILQTFTGSFYPAKYIAAGDPPLLIPAGVSDGPTKNGFLVSFCLSAMLARFIFKKFFFNFFDLSIFVLGFISLILSASRAGLISFVGVFLIFIFLKISFIIKHRYFKTRVSFYLFLLTPLILFPILLVKFGISMKVLIDLSSSDDKYGVRTIVYKASNYYDDSTLERAQMFTKIFPLLKENPFYIFSCGMGAGTFENLNSLNIHNSWLELFLITGSFGFFCFVCLNIYLLRKLHKSRYALLLMPVIFSLFSVMIFMLAHDILRGRIFWIALGIIGGYVSISQKSILLTKQLRKLS